MRLNNDGLSDQDAVEIPSRCCPVDTIVQGDCVQVMRQLPATSVDFKRHKIDVLTVAPRSQAMMGGEGLIVTHLDVQAVQP